MKTVVFILDGAADLPLDKLGGKTPLETAFHHNMDLFASYGAFGTVSLVSDASVFGLDAPSFMNGGSFFAAKGAGASLDKGDLSYFCNTVTLSDADSFENAVMLDFGAFGTDGFSSSDAVSILKTSADIELYTGRSYCHSFILRNADAGGEQTEPFKVCGKRVGDFLPRGRNAEKLCEIMRASYEKLNGFWKNEGEGSPVSAVWLWGESRALKTPSYKEIFGDINASLLAESDRVFGAGACLSMGLIKTPSLNGRFDTNYDKMAESVKYALDTGEDLIFVCAEGARESSLRGNIRDKIYSIEKFDERLIGPVMQHLEDKGEDFTALCLSGKAASVEKKELLDIPVPFAYYKSFSHPTHKTVFNEKNAQETGVKKDSVADMIKSLLKKD